MNTRLVGLSLLVAITSITGGCALAAPEAARPVRKKLIATGWDSPTPATFRAHLAEFEKFPFDGTVIRPTRVTADGKTLSANMAFSREQWSEGEFQVAVSELKSAAPVTATENFLLLNASPGEVDWFDDAGWKEIADHWRMLTRVAREGRLRGLAFDIEPYTLPFQQFNYSAQPEHQRHSFDEYAAKARERGREIMRIVSDEYPSITILCYRLFSDLLGQTHGKDNDKILLARLEYGLIPAFLNGWLDEMPRTVTVVDGNELSYTYISEAEFVASYAEIKDLGHIFVAKGNRWRFDRCWRVGQAVYLDLYCDPVRVRRYTARHGGSAIDELEANTASALRASDEYVWVYGEKGLWWPSPAKYPAWPVKLPGLEAALSKAKGTVNQP